MAEEKEEETENGQRKRVIPTLCSMDEQPFLEELVEKETFICQAIYLLSV